MKIEEKKKILVQVSVCKIQRINQNENHIMSNIANTAFYGLTHQRRAY